VTAQLEMLPIYKMRQLLEAAALHRMQPMVWRHNVQPMEMLAAQSLPTQNVVCNNGSASMFVL
jgi:hypothetical protein